MFSLHKIPVSAFLFSISLALSAGDPFLDTSGAPEAGMGFSCIMKPGFWSSFHNQALLPLAVSPSFGINYESRFNIPELGTRSAAVIIPAGKVVLGGIYSNFGFSGLMRHSSGIACGMKLAERISAGVQIDYFAESTRLEESNRQILTFEAGISIAATEKVSLAIHVFNPLPQSSGRNNLTSSLRAGAGLNLSETIFVSAETGFSSGYGLELRSGIEYASGKGFRIRGGFGSRNSAFSFGFGYRVKGFDIDLGFVSHERLGISSSASIIYILK